MSQEPKKDTGFIDFDKNIKNSQALREEFSKANRPTRSLSLAYAMTLNGMFMLALAIAIWLPCLLLALNHMAYPVLNLTAVLYGTVYMMVTEGLLALCLIFTPWEKAVARVAQKIETHE